MEAAGSILPVRASLTSLCVALLLAAPAALAQAAPAPTDTRTAILLRAGDAGAERLAGALESRLGAALVARGIDVTDFAELYPPPEGPSLAHADALFEEGRRAFDELDPDLARRKLTEAAAVYAQHPVVTRTETLAQVFIYLGANALMEGRKERALEAFRRAVVLAPGVEPDAAIFGPEVAVAYANAQSSLDARPTQQFEVSSLPSGARVRVGGKELGSTPLEPMPLPRGRHHVVLSRPGHAPWGEFTDVGDVPVTLRPKLEPLPGLAETQALAAPLLDETQLQSASGPMPAEAAALASRLEARWLVLVVVSTEGNATRAIASVWDTATGNRLSGLSVPVDDADWAGALELSERVRAFITAPPPPPAVAKKSFEAPALLRRWWFWAAVGGTLAAGAGVYAVGQASGARPDFVVLGVP